MATKRDLILERYRASNPDIEGDIDDETLYGYADEVAGKHKELADTNSKFMERISSNPRTNAFFDMFLNSDEGDIFDDEEYFNVGFKDYLDSITKGKELKAVQDENLKKYDERLRAFAQANDVDEAGLGELNDKVISITNDLIMASPSDELLEYIWKGSHYDGDLQAAAQEGAKATRNDAIRAELKKKAGDGALPDLHGGTGIGKGIKEEPMEDDSRFGINRKSFSDTLKPRK
jgi:hypothetical protein